MIFIFHHITNTRYRGRPVLMESGQPREFAKQRSTSASASLQPTTQCHKPIPANKAARKSPAATLKIGNPSFGACAVTTAVGCGPFEGLVVPARTDVVPAGADFCGPTVTVTVAVTVFEPGTCTVTVTGAGHVAGLVGPLPGHSGGGGRVGSCPPGCSGVHGVLGGPCGQVPGPGGFGHLPGFPV